MYPPSRPLYNPNEAERKARIRDFVESGELARHNDAVRARYAVYGWKWTGRRYEKVGE